MGTVKKCLLYCAILYYNTDAVSLVPPFIDIYKIDFLKECDGCVSNPPKVRKGVSAARIAIVKFWSRGDSPAL